MSIGVWVVIEEGGYEYPRLSIEDAIKIMDEGDRLRYRKISKLQFMSLLTPFFAYARVPAVVLPMCGNWRYDSIREDLFFKYAEEFYGAMRLTIPQKVFNLRCKKKFLQDIARG